jgi:hypothetical protein
MQEMALNYKFITFVFIAGIALKGCQQKKAAQTPPPPAEIKKEIKASPFTPPADSTITAEQMKAWVRSNEFLDSLTELYSDSFKVSDPVKRMHYQDVFSSAQDKICVLNGLSGGYKEYKWIINNIGNPKNRAVVEAAGVTVH